MEKETETEVLIIGAGVIGLSIAHELTRHGVRPLIIDKESDVGLGISKSSGGFVNAGLMQAVDFLVKEMTGGDPWAEIDNERARSMIEGYAAFDPLVHDLDIAHQHLGTIVFGRNESEIRKLRRLMEVAEHFPRTRLEWLERDRLLEKEPNLTPEAQAGIYDPDGTILVFSPEYVIALAENACENGAELMLDAACLNIHNENDVYRVKTEKGAIKARFVVNCAGRYADRVADMAGARKDWNLIYFRTQVFILDRRLEGTIHNFMTLPPAGMKVQAISPLIHGNLLLYGSSIEPVKDPEAVQNVAADFESAIETMKVLVPSISENDIVTAYTGVRVYCSQEPENHYIAYSPLSRNFINVIPRMPGFTPAIEIGRKVAHMLEDQGLVLSENTEFNPKRKSMNRFRELVQAEKNRLIASDPRYGKIVCRCETVSEGEIIEAVRRGANTVQGVMFRTRAGMGRCQRNFCGPKIMEIIAREKRIPIEAVTFKGGRSYCLSGKTGKKAT